MWGKLGVECGIKITPNPQLPSARLASCLGSPFLFHQAGLTSWVTLPVLPGWPHVSGCLFCSAKLDLHLRSPFLFLQVRFTSRVAFAKFLTDMNNFKKDFFNGNKNNFFYLFKIIFKCLIATMLFVAIKHLNINSYLVLGLYYNYIIQLLMFW